jgi:hypothetical protein
MIGLISEIALWVGIGVQIYDGIVTPRRYGRGKLTRVMAKRVCNSMYALSPGLYRLVVQWAPVWLAWVAVDHTQSASKVVTRIVYAAFLIVVYGDDILTGGDDQWKRRLRALKNKINWQWLPQMEPVPRVARVPI